MDDVLGITARRACNRAEGGQDDAHVTRAPRVQWLARLYSHNFRAASACASSYAEDAHGHRAPRILWLA